MSPDPANRICDILAPDRGSPRARKVVTRSRWRNTYKLPASKAGRLVEAESWAEFNAHQLLEVDPTVVRFAEQPLLIRYVMNGIQREHFPDVRVDRNDRTVELWEIKTARDAAIPLVMARTALLRQQLAGRFTYRLVIAESLNRQPRLDNIRFLLKFGRRRVDPQTQEHFRQLALAAEGISWEAVRTGTLGPDARGVICRLTLDGLLHIDLDAHISADTKFHFSEEAREIIP